MRLTKTIIAEAVAKLAAGNISREVLWDDDLPGFGVRITRKQQSFFLDYYGEGNRRRQFTIGTTKELSPETARKRAAELKLSVRAGGDPMQDRRRSKKATDELTIAQISERWLADGASRWTVRTANDYRYTVQCHILPEIGAEAAAEVSKADIAAMVGKVRAKSPAVAGKVLRTVSAMLRWAEDLELLEEAKLPRVKRTAPPVQPRERVLSDEDICKLWLAADEINPLDAGFVKLVILTALRSTPASKARQEWLKGNTLLVPATEMKNGKAHSVPIPAWAADLVAARLDGGGRPANPVLRDIRKLTGIKDMQWHDIRRSFATNRIAADNAMASPANKLAGRRPRTRRPVSSSQSVLLETCRLDRNRGVVQEEHRDGA